MLFPIIRVRDKQDESSKSVIVGTNSHHSLMVNDRGDIHFVHMQCMDGTGTEEGYGFEFVAKEGYFGAEIEMVTFEELLKIYSEQVDLSCKAEAELREFSKRLIENMKKKYKLDEPCEIRHSAGILVD